MSKETENEIPKAFDSLYKDYDVRLDKLVAEPLKEINNNVPFSFNLLKMRTVA